MKKTNEADNFFKMIITAALSLIILIIVIIAKSLWPLPPAYLFLSVAGIIIIILAIIVIWIKNEEEI